jgi:hypothetical protein
VLYCGSMNQQKITRVRYTHDAVIDEILINPAVAQKDLAVMFGLTQTTMSIIVNSDAFKNRLAERKAELIDPAITASIQERLDAVARRSLDRIMERLDSPGAIKDTDLVSMAKLGVGDKNNRVAQPQVQTNLYVVALPAPAPNAQVWLDNSSGVIPTPRPLPLVQEVSPG